MFKKNIICFCNGEGTKQVISSSATFDIQQQPCKIMIIFLSLHSFYFIKNFIFSVLFINVLIFHILKFLAYKILNLEIFSKLSKVEFKMKTKM
jgi:hypothetical protein